MLTLLAFTLLVPFGSGSARAQAVSIGNPGFESGNSRWSDWGNAAAVSGHARSGAMAMRVGNDAGGRGQAVALAAGATYRLEGWGKVAAAGEAGWIGVTINDGGGREVKHFFQITETAYTRKSVTFTTPSAVREARVWVWKDQGRSSYFYADDVSLARVSTGATATAPASESAAAVQLRSMVGNSLCMDAGGLTAGTRVAVAECQGRDSQKFLPQSGGELRTVNGLCVDVAGGRGNNGDALVLAACQGGASQKWEFAASGAIRGVHGRVIDVWRSTPGTHLVVWDYHGDSNQRWTRTSAGSTSLVNAPPRVSLTSPASGASFTAPAQITLSATATDSDGAVSKVEFFAGATLIGTATGAPYQVAWKNVAAGTYAISAKATDNRGAVATSPAVSVSVAAAQPAVACPTSVPSNAFQACYYDNADFTDLKLARIDKAIAFDWGNGSPDPGIATDTFSVTWRGNFSFEAGAYEFTATADDGIRLYVGGALVIDQWRVQAPTTFKATRTMTAGVHPVRVEYFENTGGAVAKLSWAKASARDTAPPSTPGALIARAASSSRVDLAWAASSDNVGVTGYRVYRNDVLAGTTTTSGFASTGLAASTHYTFQVSAVDAAGNESARSAAVAATTRPGAAYPNLPAGYARITEHAGHPWPQDWWRQDPEGNISVDAPSDLPRPESSSVRFRFKAGLAGGASAGMMGHGGQGGGGTLRVNDQPARDLYVAYWYRMSPDWELAAPSGAAHGQTTLFEVQASGAGRSGLFQLNLSGPARTRGAALSTEVVSAGSVQLQKLAANVSNITLKPGEWYLLEYELRNATAADASLGADIGWGSVRWWVNGVLAGDHTRVPRPVQEFTGVQLSPGVGTEGSALQREQHSWYHHIHVAGKPHAGMPAAPAAGAYPNQPAGMTRITEHKGNPWPAEWWRYDPSKNVTAETVGDHPTPGASAVRFRYPQGLPGGSGPGMMGHGHGELGQAGNISAGGKPLRELYVAFWMKLSPGWRTPEWQPGSTGQAKLFYMFSWKGGTAWDAARWDVHPNVAGYAGGPYTLEVTATFANSAWNGWFVDTLQPNVKNIQIETGRWYLLEYYVKRSSALGASDGRIAWWVNGQPVGDYVNRRIAPHAFTEVNWSPVWGGGGAPLVQEQYAWFSNIYVSGR